MEGFQEITYHRFFHWMPEQICRGSVADVGFDVVCYNIDTELQLKSLKKILIA